jgi:hypothetical protein
MVRNLTLCFGDRRFKCMALNQLPVGFGGFSKSHKVDAMRVPR